MMELDLLNAWTYGTHDYEAYGGKAEARDIGIEFTSPPSREALCTLQQWPARSTEDAHP
jgi:hypothetical protein